MSLQREASIKTQNSSDTGSSAHPSSFSSLASSPDSESMTSPDPSPQPQTPRRYPDNLSRKPRPDGRKLSIDTEPPHVYQSLEELLRVNGFKETRVFTPEAERIQSSADLKKDGGDAAQNETSGVAESVMTFLTGWMPGTSMTLGRMKGEKAQDKLQQEESSTNNKEYNPLYVGASQSRPTHSSPLALETPLTTALRASLESSLRPSSKQTRESAPMESHPEASRWSTLPFDPSAYAPPVAPSSSSSTIRPSERQLQQTQHRSLLQKHSVETLPNQKRSSPPLPPGSKHLHAPTTSRLIRHVNSTPNMGKQRIPLQRANSHTTPKNTSPTRPLHSPSLVPETWIQTLSSMLNATLNSTAAIHQDNPRTGVPSSETHPPTTNTHMPHLLQMATVPTNALTVVKTDPVLCRSAPASRSTSRVRGSDSKQPEIRRTGSISRKSASKRISMPTNANLPNFTSPLLSPSVASQEGDPNAVFWGNDVDDASDHFRLYKDPAGSLRGRVESDPDPPNLDAILASWVPSHAGRTVVRSDPSECSSTRSSFEDNGSTSLSVPSGISQSPDRPDLRARRQRSIRTLRAHLAASDAASSSTSSSGKSRPPTIKPPNSPGRNAPRNVGRSNSGRRTQEAIPPVPTLPPQFRLTSPNGTETPGAQDAIRGPRVGLIPAPVGRTSPTKHKEAFLEGPEWESYQGTARKRGLLPIPWLGSHEKRRSSSAWEEPDTGRGRK